MFGFFDDRFLCELNMLQPLVFALQIDLAYQIYKVKPHGIHLLFVGRQTVSKGGRKNEAFSDGLTYDRLLILNSVSETAFHRLDEALSREQQEIVLIGIIQGRSWRGKISQRLQPAQLLEMPYRQRGQQIVQIGVPAFIDLRFWRGRTHPEVVVLVGAALKLVRSAQQVHIDLEPPAKEAA